MKKILLIIILLFTISVKAETITISSNTSLSDKKIEDNREQSNVIIVNNGDLDIKDSTITKSGNGNDSVIDSYNNSAIVINENSKLKGDKLEVNTEGDFAHGIYYKEKTESTIKNSNIKTINKYSVGIINEGGKINISDTSIETKGNDSAGIYVVGGEIEVNKGSITTNSVDSPLIKAASKITLDETKLVANYSEGIVGIPGADITFNKVSLESNNITALEANYKSIYFYKPVGLEGNIVFNAKDSKIITKTGNTFNIVNAIVTINLENNEIDNTNGVFLKAYTNEYDDETNNDIKLNLTKQLVKGNILTDKNTVMNIYLDNSEYIGSINANNAAKEINLTLTKDSKIMLTSNINVNSLTNGDYENSNINLNGYKLYINGEELSKDNIIHLDEKNDTLYIILGFIIGVMLGYSIIYLYIKAKSVKK